MLIKNRDNDFMQLALEEAKKAYNNNDIPVGCVIVKDDTIIASGFNKRELLNNCIMHAEIIAISEACEKLKQKFLEECTIYVTLEPCLMCAGAIMQARMKKVVYALEEPKHGCLSSLGSIYNDYMFNHKVDIIKGVEKEQAEILLKSFFSKLRNKK